MVVSVSKPTSIQCLSMSNIFTVFVHVQHLYRVCLVGYGRGQAMCHGQTMDLCVQSLDFCVQCMDFGIQSLDFGIQSLDLGVQSLDRPCTLADFIGQSLDLVVQSLDLEVQSLDRCCTLGNAGQCLDRHWTKVGQSLDFDVQSLDLGVQATIDKEHPFNVCTG